MKDLEIEVVPGKRILRIVVNKYKPVVEYSLPQGSPSPEYTIEGNAVRASLFGVEEELKFEVSRESLVIRRSFSPGEKVIGLGEKALPLERSRKRVVFWNYDNWGYRRGSDPLYISIPFAIFSRGGRVSGIFVNYPGYLVFDLGATEYDEARVEVIGSSAEAYLIFGRSAMEVLETYTELTGRPFIPPRWALKPQLSRYSYYPQENVLKVVDMFRAYADLGAIYLDIDYMDSYKQFTWDPKRFSRPREMVEELHRRGVRVITIIDPYIKVDPDYEVFRESIGYLVRRSTGEIYVARGWPGFSAIPDFFNKGAREWWAHRIEMWAREYGVDGVWIDMNEPTVFKEPGGPRWASQLAGGLAMLAKAIERVSALAGYPIPAKGAEDLLDLSPDPDVVHSLDDGRVLPHSAVRNAYPLFQAMATYEGLRRVYQRPFILSRAGYPGIQSYAAVWTGDNVASWDHLRLSIQMVLGLSASGVAWAGVDVGGFVGDAEPELAARWYQACALLPIFRVHKSKGGAEAEIYSLPPRYREMALRALRLRAQLEPYLWHLAWEAHLSGRPVVRPIALEYPEDEEGYYADDEYLVGSSVLYAPIVERGATGRWVYIPRGRWIDYWSGEEHDGPSWIYSSAEMPLYIKRGSAIPTSEGLEIYGQGVWRIYYGDEGGAFEVSSSEGLIEVHGRAPEVGSITLLGVGVGEALVDGDRAEIYRVPRGTVVRVGRAFKRLVYR